MSAVHAWEFITVLWTLNYALLQPGGPRKYQRALAAIGCIAALVSLISG